MVLENRRIMKNETEESLGHEMLEKHFFDGMRLYENVAGDLAGVDKFIKCPSELGMLLILILKLMRERFDEFRDMLAQLSGYTLRKDLHAFRIYPFERWRDAIQAEHYTIIK